MDARQLFVSFSTSATACMNRHSARQMAAPHLEQAADEFGGRPRLPLPGRHARLPRIQAELRLKAERPLQIITFASTEAETTNSSAVARTRLPCMCGCTWTSMTIERQ